MRVEYINPFSEAAYSILIEVLQAEKDAVKRGAGDVEGRVIFDMTMTTALNIASAMNGEEVKEFDELARATIAELANLITARAITKLHDLGFKFDLTPPAILSGENMQISNKDMEALIVPLDTPQGEVEINVALRDKV